MNHRSNGRISCGCLHEQTYHSPGVFIYILICANQSAFLASLHIFIRQVYMRLGQFVHPCHVLWPLSWSWLMHRLHASFFLLVNM